MKYEKIEDFRKEYLEVKDHIYRQTNSKEFEKDYYLKLYQLCYNLENYIYYKVREDSRTNAQRLYLAVYHDNISNILGMNHGYYKEYKDDILVTNEQYLMLVHSILDNKEVKFAYNFYTGCNPLGTKENEMRKSKYFINKNTTEVQRYLTQEDKDLLIKKYKEKLKVYKDSQSITEYYTRYLEWAESTEVYSDDLNIYKEEIL